MLNYISFCKIEGNKLIRTDSVEIQVNTRKGDDAGSVFIFYSKNENLNIGEAWIEDMRGNIIRKLKKNEITDRHAISYYALYQDDFVKEFQLRHNVYPYKIKYSYKISTFDFLFITNWLPFLKWNQPVKSARLTVEIPVDFAIKKKEENISPSTEETANNFVKYTWNTSFEGKKRQKYVPESSLKIPSVTIQPLDFKYGKKGSWKSWETFGKWIRDLNANGEKLPLIEEQKVDQLLQGISDPKEKVRILYKYLQKETRYINIKINTGGLKSYPSEYVSANKYGDCKALSNFMVSLLNYAGIKSYYTLVNAGEEIEDFDKDFPTQAFNHVIVTVPFEKDTIFLECTNKNVPCGYLGTFTQGRNVLMVDGENSKLTTTPLLEPEDVVCSSTIEIYNSKINITSKQRGDLYENSLFYISETSKENIENYIHNIYSGNFDIGEYKFNITNPNKPEIDMHLSLNKSNNLKSYGKNLILSSFPQNLPSIDAPNSSNINTLQFDYPIVYRDTVIYHLEDIQSIKKSPENINLESPFGKYETTFNFSETKFILIKNITIFRGRYENIETCQHFYNFLSNVKSYENKNIYLELE